MATRANQIEGQAAEIRRHIERQREVLGANLETLEQKMRSATNWRTWLDRKPLLFLGLAFGSGLYLSLKTGK